MKLKIKTEHRPKSRLAIEVTVPAERCKASYDNALSALSRSIKLPGFRKGKVPKAVLLQQIGPIRIKATAIEQLIEAIWKEAVTQESIEALCDPELNEGFEQILEKFSVDNSLTLSLETDISPIPKLKTTEGLKAEFEPIKFNNSKS